jgi:Uri superfamily endonuclease
LGEQFDIPGLPGTYALLMYLADNKRISVGHLGEYDLLPGDYVYLGSAFGSGGLRARLKRHYKIEKKKHWHLDWILPHVSIKGVCYRFGPEKLECEWVQMLIGTKDALYAVPGFGSSDCVKKCEAHLIYFEEELSLVSLSKLLNAHSHSFILIS